MIAAGSLLQPPPSLLQPLLPSRSQGSLFACRHSALAHFCWWNRYVANPIKKHGYVGKGRAAMRILKNEILDKILLRRTKVQCADVLALPPR